MIANQVRRAATRAAVGGALIHDLFSNWSAGTDLEGLEPSVISNGNKYTAQGPFRGADTAGFAPIVTAAGYAGWDPASGTAGLSINPILADIRSTIWINTNANNAYVFIGAQNTLSGENAEYSVRMIPGTNSYAVLNKAAGSLYTGVLAGTAPVKFSIEYTPGSRLAVYRDDVIEFELLIGVATAVDNFVGFSCTNTALVSELKVEAL